MSGQSVEKKPGQRIRILSLAGQRDRAADARARLAGGSRQHVREWLDLAIRSAKMGAWVWYPREGGIQILRTDQYDRIMGIEEDAPWSLDNLLSRMHPLDRERMRQRIESVISGATEDYDAEYRIVTQCGEIRWVRSRGRAIRARDGKVVRVTGIVTDITERKLLEQDRDQFVATLTHDIRNPLAAARAGAELILRYPGRESERARLLRRIVSSIEQADRRIQDLLDSSRMKRGRGLQLLIERFDLRDFVGELVEKIAGEYSGDFGGRILFSAECPIEGYWSRRAIKRIVESLIGNAVRYGEPGGPITVTLRRERDSRGDLAVLGVHNQGNPIPESAQGDLFEVTQQLGSGAPEEGAPEERAKEPWRRRWGLGLAVVRGLARAHGGSIEVRSSEAEGTNFTVRFPVKGRSSGSAHE